MLQDINNFLHTLNSEDGAHNNTILSYKYDINQFRGFLIKKKITFTKIKKIMYHLLTKLVTLTTWAQLIRSNVVQRCYPEHPALPSRPHSGPPVPGR